jgi:hypothetical protein
MLPFTWSPIRCDHQRGMNAAPIQPPTITTVTAIAVYASHRFHERPLVGGGAAAGWLSVTRRARISPCCPRLGVDAAASGAYPDGVPSSERRKSMKVHALHFPQLDDRLS